MTENELDLINRRNIDYFNELNSEDRSFIIRVMSILSRSSMKDSDLHSIQKDLVGMASEAEASGSVLRELLGMPADKFCENILDTCNANRNGKFRIFLHSLFGMYFVGFAFLILFSSSSLIQLGYYLVMFLGLSYLNTYAKTRLTLQKKDPDVWRFVLYFLVLLIPSIALSLLKGFELHTLSVPKWAIVCGLIICVTGHIVTRSK